MEKLKLEKMPVEEVIQELGLPEEARFVGYVVHLPESDEFLVKIKKQKGSEKRLWIQGVPDKAKVYGWEKAVKQVVEYGKGAVVGYLFDLENQYMVGSCMDPVFNEEGMNSVTINYDPAKPGG